MTIELGTSLLRRCLAFFTFKRRPRPKLVSSRCPRCGAGRFIGSWAESGQRLYCAGCGRDVL